MFFGENEMCFWQKPGGVILHDRNFDGTKSILHSCLTLWRRIVFASIFRSAKNQLQFGKKLKKLRHSFHPLICPKNQSEKISTTSLTSNIAYIALVQFTKLRNWSRSWDIGAQGKRTKVLKQNSSIFGRKTKASCLMMETLLVQKVTYILAVFLEG